MTMLRSFTLPDAPTLRSDGDENVLEGWIVPFNQVADVTDLTPEGVKRYREGFLPGSLTRIEQGCRKRGNAAWIRLTMDHDSSDRIGFCRQVEQRGDEGGWASFRLYDSADILKVRSMLELSHDGFSIEFVDVIPPDVAEDGTVWRRQVDIPTVTVTPIPAYESAKVLELRDQADPLADNTEGLDYAQQVLEEIDARR
jgi:HK97 family phage prohead protease